MLKVNLNQEGNRFEIDMKTDASFNKFNIIQKESSNEIVSQVLMKNHVVPSSSKLMYVDYEDSSIMNCAH